MNPAFKRHPGKVYGASKGRAPGSKIWYRRVYSGGKWDEFLKMYAVGTMLQVCTGGSKIGDVRLDIDPAAPGANVRGDALRLPLKNESFDTVACDPIYKMDYPHRIRLQRELARVARRRIVFKAPWIPRAHGFKLVDTWLVGSHTCADVAVISILERRR